MYALWRHPSCLHTLTIVSSLVSLLLLSLPTAGSGRPPPTPSLQWTVVVPFPRQVCRSEAALSPYSGLGSSSSHAKFVVAKSLESARACGR